ncbi:MerR family transcriptional regulator [Christensenellaceae bacterium OttesenSCG-928-M15]|nr:MerR family transcriptional regulator [Christensenellaceae bacterium OttesenSCG-928-M15]
MQKYFKISEIAKLYKIGTDSLRYYEKLGILEPKRDTNGYRLYSLKDIWRLNVIRDLRALGFSMERIGQYLQNRSTETTYALLQEELKLLDEEIGNLNRLRENVEDRLTTIRLAQEQPTGIVQERYIKERRLFVINQPYRLDEEMDVLIKQLLNMAKESVALIGSNRLGSFLTIENALKDDYHYDGSFLIDESGPEILPAGDHLTLTFHGDASSTHASVPVLLAYAKEHGYTPMGRIMELLWVDIHTASDRSEYLTEVQLLVQT